MVHEAKRQELRRLLFRFSVSLTVAAILLAFCFPVVARAASFTVDLGRGETEAGGGVLEIFMIFGLLALLPSIVIMMTSFTRIIIVLSFLRNALGTQQSPPNQVLVGIALFLSLFIMSPVLDQINTQAYVPYRNGELTQTEALQRAEVPLKEFMLRQTKEKEMKLFIELSGRYEDFDAAQAPNLEALSDLGLEVIVPAFMTSEIKRAFSIGFYLFIPFLIIDLVVSSTLMSMGMVMLPPSMISLPFKIMMFVLVDGWNLLFNALVRGFG